LYESRNGQAFWWVVQSELSPEERRLLLLFITGTERLPEAGCETLSIEVGNQWNNYSSIRDSKIR